MDDLWTVDVQIQPAQAYLLAAPWDGRILQPPVLGQVYDAQPDLPSGNEELLALFRRWETQGDDKAVVITSYPAAILDKIHKKSERFNNLNSYLYLYGQPPASYKPAEELWEESLDQSSKDLVGSLRDEMTTDVSKLRALLQALRKGQGQPPPALLDSALVYKRPGRAPLRSLAELEQFHDAIEKTTIYNLRDVLKLNAPTYNISNGPGDGAELRPNSISLFRQTSPKFVFELQRTSGMYAREDGYAEKLADYWKQVSEDELFTVKDMEFLRYLAAHKYNDSNKWKDLVPELIAEATKAAEAIRRLRNIERFAGNLLIFWGGVSYLPTYKANLPPTAKSIGLELTNEEIDDIGRAAAVASAYAQEIISLGVPRSTDDSVSWMVGQAMKSRKVFEGELIEVSTRAGAAETDPSLPINASINLDPYFELIKFSNGYSFNLRLLRPSDAFYFSGKDDPFADLVSQYLVMAAPVIAAVSHEGAGSSRTVSADQIRSAAYQVAFLRADLLSKIRERGDSVRKEFEDLRAQVGVEFNDLRYGHIVVPETAIVDSVSVSRDDFVRKGDPIAVIHPAFKHTLVAKFGRIAQASRIFMVGSLARWRFYCDGPIATTLEQKEGILVRSDKLDILQMLSKIKQNALNNIVFTGYVESINEDHGDNAVRISFEVPMEGKTLSLESFDGTKGFAMRERLGEVKFDVGSSSDAPPRSVLRLRAGLFDPDEKCTARFILPEAVKSARSLENEWRSLWGGR